LKKRARKRIFSFPEGGLTYVSGTPHGTLYGTTTAGGTNDDGTVFFLSVNGSPKASRRESAANHGPIVPSSKTQAEP
jgi:uncharacterized repeat protein (TIGR03803 family)